MPARPASVSPTASGSVAHGTSAPARPVSHREARHASATRAASTRVGPLSFPLALPRDLLLLPRVGDPGRQDGVLLLLSAAAMAVVAVASFTLLRRLRRLEAA